MKRFLRNFSFRVCLMFFLFIIIGCYLFQMNIPPHYTNSFSLNAKLLHMQKQSFNQIELFSIGSSMTLNNLNSEIIVDKFGNSYYNFSSWGENISTTKNFCELYAELYKPRLIIIASSYGDFHEGGIEYPSFLTTIFSLKMNVLNWGYAGCIGILTTIKAYRHNQHCFLDNQQYTSLAFDSYGGVPLNIPPNKINMKRWNMELQCTTTESQYMELKELSKYLFDRNIKLVLVQCPIRKCIINEHTKKQMEQHRIKCEEILNTHRNIYLDYALDEELSGEGLFVDRTHLNEIGSKFFTQSVVLAIDSLGILK